MVPTVQQTNQWQQRSPVQVLANKVLQGQPLTMTIIGGSNTAGGGVHNDQHLYYNFFRNWWNKRGYGSTLTNHKIAIGGTGSDFFSFCFQNFLGDKEPDIVLVELAVNDYGYKYGMAAQPMELLTRRLLSLSSVPLVVYVNLVDRGIYNNKITNTVCNNMEDLGFDDLAQHYGIPNISWRDTVCPLVGNVRKQLKNPNKFEFNVDGSHVAVKAHQQVAYQLVQYFASILPSTNSGYYSARSILTTNKRSRDQNLTNSSNSTNVLPHKKQDFKRRNEHFNIQFDQKNRIFSEESPPNKADTHDSNEKYEDMLGSPMPPKFTTVSDNDMANSMCLTFLSPDWRVPLQQTLQAKVIYSKDFTYLSPAEYKKIAKHLMFRTDAYGAWAAKTKGAMLKMSFVIPQGSARSVSLIFRTKDNEGNKANSLVWVDGDKKSAITVDSNKCGHHMYQTRLQSLATHVSPGYHTLNVQSNGHGWFEVSGLIVGYAGYQDYEGYRPFDVKAKMWSEENYEQLKC